jgi:phage baseplate assembly protein W
MDQNYLAFPFSIDGRGRTATSGKDDHLRALIYEVLFTSPGERVNRPDFGCGLKNLVFMPNSEPLAGATQLMVRGALQNWLQAEIQVEGVEVAAVEERLNINVTYTRRDTGERRVEQFSGIA